MSGSPREHLELPAGTGALPHKLLPSGPRVSPSLPMSTRGLRSLAHSACSGMPVYLLHLARFQNALETEQMLVGSSFGGEVHKDLLLLSCVPSLGLNVTKDAKKEGGGGLGDGGSRWLFVVGTG